MKAVDETERYSDDLIMAEAIRMVECGVSITFPVNGRSMLPFIVGGKDSLVLVKPDAVKVGDVVLALVEENRYVIHRVESVEGDFVTLMGDGNLLQREHCKMSGVKAVATHVVNKDGNRRSLNAGGLCFAAKLWVMCLPIRRWLLKLYLVTHRV